MWLVLGLIMFLTIGVAKPFLPLNARAGVF